jgi:hypothetical protein
LEKKIRNNIEKLKQWKEFSRKVSDATPDLNETIKTFEFFLSDNFKKVSFSKTINDETYELVNFVNEWTSDNFTVSDATSATSICSSTCAHMFDEAKGYSANSYSRQRTPNSGDNWPIAIILDDLRNFSDEITEDNNIEDLIIKIGSESVAEFKKLKRTYILYKDSMRNVSDVAKDMRNFIERFKGELNKLRMKTGDYKKQPKISWNKMAKDICKNKSIVKKTFLQQRTACTDLHSDLSQILKKGKLYDSNVSKEDIDDYWRKIKSFIKSSGNAIKEEYLN